MVDFVCPGKLGDIKTFSALFVEHINRGAVSYNDADDKKRRKAMDRRVFTLAKRLDTLVQRRGVELLAKTLVPLTGSNGGRAAPQPLPRSRCG